MDVTSLVATPLVGGPRSGIHALLLELGPGKAYAPAALHREIERAAPKSRLISVSIPNFADVDPKEISTLARLLRDSGWRSSVATVGALAYPDWLDLFPYRTALLSNEPWIGWRADEIHYSPSDDTWVEPELTAANQSSACYVEVRREADYRRALDFLMKARRLWGIIQQPRQVFAVRFIGG